MKNPDVGAIGVLIVMLAGSGWAATPGDGPASSEDYPTQARPWKRAEHRGYEQTIRALMNTPPAQVRPHPAAEDFPGAPSPSAPRVTRKIQLDTRVPRWHSTGLYAAPGEQVSVIVPPQAAGRGLRVRIGCHQDVLWAPRIKTWSRVPEITRAFAITREEILAANAFGGLIYLVVPPNCALGTIEVTVRNAVPAPLFELGKTTPEQWRREIRHRLAPWAELAGHCLIIALPSASARKLDDPSEAMRFWDRAVEAQDNLVGGTQRPSPERFVLDRQIGAGYMHSGYPIMAHLDQADRVASLAEFHKNTKGFNGFFHELGHNHQRPEWTFAGNGEVSCNIFVWLAQEKAGQKEPRKKLATEPSWKHNVDKFFAEGGDFEAWKTDPLVSLVFYNQLIEAFGWEALKKLYGQYRSLPRSQLPKNEPEKRDQFLVRLSRCVGRDLGLFFEAWRIPTSQQARDSIKDLPAWMPTGFPPAGYAASPPQAPVSRGNQTNAVERVNSLKEAYNRGLMDKETYDQKVKEILDAL
jgi:hypothetical protein